MTNTTKFEAIDAAIKATGADVNDMQSSGRTVALTVVAHRLFPAAFLPESFAIVKSSDDVQGAIQRVAEDDAFVVSVLRGLALYTDSVITGVTTDVKADVQSTYDAFKAADEVGKRAIIVEVAKLFDKVITDETIRCGGEDLIKQTEGQLEGLIEEYQSRPLFSIFEPLHDAEVMCVQIAQQLITGAGEGRSVEASLDANRHEGMMSTFAYRMMFEQLLAQVFEAVIRHRTGDQAEAVIAMIEKSGAEEAGELTLH